ncbi:MAG: MFS transporter [Oscillospiraceae bacterium]
MDKSSRGFIYDNMLAMSAYWACSGTIIAGLTSYFDIPVALASIMTGLTSTLPLLQLAGGFGYSHTANRHRFVLVYNTLWRLVMPFAFFAVLMPKSIGSAVMMISVVLEIGIYQYACPSQTDWMVSHVEGKVNNNYYSIREMCFMFVYTVIFAAVSMAIDTATRKDNVQAGYVIVGVIVIVLLVLSLVVLFRLPPPLNAVKTEKTKISFKEPLLNKPFRRVMFTNMIFSFSGMMVGSYAAMYQIRIMKLDFFYVMIFTTVANIARAVITPLMAKLAARISWKWVTAISMCIAALNGLTWFFVTADNIRILFPIVSLLVAIPNAGMGVGLLKMQVENSPSDNRSMYFSVNSTMNGAAAFVGSMLCSVLIGVIEALSPINGQANLKYIFIIGTVITFIAAFAATKIKSEVK